MAVLRANPTFARVTRACISKKTGRLPSYTADTTEPSSLSMFSIRLPEISGTSIMPSSVMRKAPISSVVPKRFLNERSILRSRSRSPLKLSTVSTICSIVFGPASSPDLVTCATMNTGTLRFFAYLISCPEHSLICVRLPATESAD